MITPPSLESTGSDFNLYEFFRKQRKVEFQRGLFILWV